MEEEFLNLGLDIIGLGVFNYDFGSITRESPVIKVGAPLRHCCYHQLSLAPLTECTISCWQSTHSLQHAQAVYGVLKEAEHRSTFYIPYWKLPLARAVVPRQRRFAADLLVINDCLDGLIAGAKQTRSEADADALQARDYTQASLLAPDPHHTLPGSHRRQAPRARRSERQQRLP